MQLTQTRASHIVIYKHVFEVHSNFFKCHSFASAISKCAYVQGRNTKLPCLSMCVRVCVCVLMTTLLFLSMCASDVCMCGVTEITVCVCVCVCVCVNMCVCVSVCLC